MLIFHNYNLPQQAKSVLGLNGETVDFSVPRLVYKAVNGHPDLFFVQTRNELVAAPNIPQNYLQLLNEKEIGYTFGRTPVGFRYPESAKYNAVITEKYFIHNLHISDPVLLQKTSGLEKIHVNQGYSRCNLLALGNSHFITSDKGMFKTLQNNGLQVLLVDPTDIQLPGFRHGFFGGTCGIWQKTVFISGSLKYHSQEELLRQFIGSAGYSITELYDGPLFDGGSIIFIT
jgi:hypothetical protein